MMRLPFLRPSALATLLLAALASCTAPRAIVTSGKVTPQGEFRGGYNLGFNLATAPLNKATDAVKDLAGQVAGQDTVRYSSSLNNLQAAALAYLLDPVQPTSDLYLRYGVLPRLDVGYKYAFGSHVFDAQYQFLGPTGTPENPGTGAVGGTTYGSVGLQFASQRAKLPSLPFLSDITDALNFSASRTDLMIPLIFSNSFGAEEKIGALSYGLVYTHSWVSYGFEPDNLYNYQNQTKVKVPTLPSQRNNFSSFGGFVNLKIGYQYFYIIPALSIFYQNYGTYTLLNNQTASISGMTFVPSLGFQVRVPKK